MGDGGTERVDVLVARGPGRAETHRVQAFVFLEELADVVLGQRGLLIRREECELLVGRRVEEHLNAGGGDAGGLLVGVSHARLVEAVGEEGLAFGTPENGIDARITLRSEPYTQTT